MYIIKRNLSKEVYSIKKIENVISLAFNSSGEKQKKKVVTTLSKKADTEVKSLNKDVVSVEEIQDVVERVLMSEGFYNVAKHFILFREKKNEYRKSLNLFRDYITDENLIALLKEIQSEYQESQYSLESLFGRFKSFYKDGVDVLKILIRASVELVTDNAPNWEYIASRLYNYDLKLKISQYRKENGIEDYKAFIKYVNDENLYSSFIYSSYSESEIEELGEYIDYGRNNLLTYSSIDLLAKRYVVKEKKAGKVIEDIQEMFMGIAMYLAIPEHNNKVEWAKKFYDEISLLRFTVATPTLSNARKPKAQMSSCFIDTVEDSLDGIYKSLGEFAKVSKWGGGMGVYMGKVRANGSDIRGVKGASGGVIKWVKLFNDTAIAVDQLSTRTGSCSITLDIWHKDVPEFLQVRTNNGDDRMKAHDIFPAISIPDLFWELAKNNIDGDWYMFCPHEVKTIMGFSLEDSYGDEWRTKYQRCIDNKSLPRRVIKVKEMVRMIIKSAVETGTPFIFNRDTVNHFNPINDKGMVYSSNLCVEILQNQSNFKTSPDEIIEYPNYPNKTFVKNISESGDFVVCNLLSLVLHHLKGWEKSEEVHNQLKNTVSIAVRLLDNVITMNDLPSEYANITNAKYRAIGVGTSGYHHLLAIEGIKWESNEHLEYVDKLYEEINYYAIKTSNELSKERGMCNVFKGSDWETGAYFDKRQYDSERWNELRESVQKYGMRNAYVMAIAPTGSTSVIAGTTAGIDPIHNKYYQDEKKGSIVPRVAPDLNDKTWWLYKESHNIDQRWVIDSASVRQRHIDQSQSLNLFITHDYSFRDLLNLYIRAWEKGVKTLYYVRSKSLEVVECVSCSS